MGDYWEVSNSGENSEMVNVFYNGFKCAVVEGGEIGEWFDIKTGVKQGCSMSGFLFLIIMDWVTRRTVGNGENGIRWRFTSKLDDLDDIALISSTKQKLQDKTTKLEDDARRVGLKVNTERTKTMRISARNQDKIVVNEIDIEDVDEFAYLGAKVCKGGGGMKDLKNR